MAFEMLRTSKNKPKLYCDGFLFNRNKCVDTTTYWSCERKSDLKCRATMILRGENSLEKKVTEHNHVPDPEKKNVLISVQSIKEKASDTSEKPIQILRGVKRTLDADSRMKLPTDNAMRKCIYIFNLSCCLSAC